MIHAEKIGVEAVEVDNAEVGLRPRRGEEVVFKIAYRLDILRAECALRAVIRQDAHENIRVGV